MSAKASNKQIPRTFCALMALVVIGVAAPAAQAGIHVDLNGGELRLTGGPEYNDAMATLEGELEPDGSWYLITDQATGELSVSGPNPPCWGNGSSVSCDSAPVQRVVISLGGGDDTHMPLEFQGKPVTWFGGEGTDELSGTAGKDTIYGEAGRDYLSDHYKDHPKDSDLLDGGFGNDDIHALEGDDTVVGGPGNDYLYSSTGHDSISGGAGKDKIYLFFGQDTVNAGPGNDFIRVGRKRTTLDCGPGRDLVANPFKGKVKMKNCERVTRKML